MPGVAPPLLPKVPAVAPVSPSDQTAAVAPPPKEPPRTTVVPPWQIAAIAGPANTVGFGLTIKSASSESSTGHTPLGLLMFT